MGGGIFCTQATFDQECYYNSPDWVIAAESICGLNCTGRCPGGSDSECPDPTICVVQADGSSGELPARGSSCRPPHSPLLATSLTLCISLFFTGYFDECVDCDPDVFAQTCIYMSDAIRSASEAKCGETCALRSNKKGLKPKFVSTRPLNNAKAATLSKDEAV